MRRAIATPRVSFAELEIHTEDGVALRAVVHDPKEGTPLRGTCVFAHAMFASKSEFGRREGRGLADAYAALGFRTIAFDFRGHSGSAMRADEEWGYDDLVRFDLPAVVDCARARSEGRPVIVVGHSLGAHVALAAQGTRRIDVDGIVAVAGNVWLREFETSRVRAVAKLALMTALRGVARRIGRFPARTIRFGNNDASARFIEDLARTTLHHAWTSADGRDDYLAALANVQIPVCAVASDGDRLFCHPASAERFVRRCRGPVRCMRITHSDDGGPPPGHMSLVTSDRARRPLIAALQWVVAPK